MKKLLLLLLLVMLASCNKMNDEMNTFIKQEYGNYGSKVNLVTEIYYKGYNVKTEFDTINDTIKCYRYNEGIKLINKLKYLDTLKCN